MMRKVNAAQRRDIVPADTACQSHQTLFGHFYSGSPQQQQRIRTGYILLSIY